MKRKIRLLIVASLFASAANAKAADSPNKWTPAEALKYRLVSDVQVSPDGKHAAFVVRDLVMESDKSEYRTQIWLADLRGGPPGPPNPQGPDGKDFFPLTFAEQASRSPRWSPDGKGSVFSPSGRTRRPTSGFCALAEASRAG